MSKLSLTDMGFLLTETAASPKHVAGLLIFKHPSKAGQDFVQSLYAQLRAFETAVAPFNQTLALGFGGMPQWQQVASFKIDEHLFFHAAKSKLMTDVGLNTLASKLHGSQLARDKPLWELHIIDGLSDGRFALYCKVHHSYADGLTVSKWLTRSLSDDSTLGGLGAFWVGANKNKQTKLKHRKKTSAIQRAQGVIKAAAGLSKMSVQWGLEKANLTNNAIAVPFNTQHTAPLTGQVTGGRQIATATIPMSRINAIRAMTQSSLNHVALSCVDGALHCYLKTQRPVQEPETITIQMPVSLRAADDDSGGNKMGIVLVELAGKDCNPYERLRDIGFSLKNVRYQIDNVPAASIVAYTLFVNLGAQMVESLGVSGSVPPLGHTLVSNVPGPKAPLYLNGAQLQEMYPISVLSPGNYLNITMYSYAGNLHFGLVASNSLQALPKLAEALEASSIELEQFIRAPYKN